MLLLTHQHNTKDTQSKNKYKYKADRKNEFNKQKKILQIKITASRNYIYASICVQLSCC